MQNLVLLLILQLARIDLLLPMSGPLAPIGNDFFDGLKMGLGRTKVEIHLWDTKNTPGRVYDAAAKIVNSQTSLIVGPLTSLNMRSLLRNVEDYNLPVISPIAKDMTLIDEYDNYFPYVLKYYMELKEQVKFVVNILGYYNFAFIMPKTSLGYSLLEQAKKFSIMYGSQIQVIKMYDPDSTDFSDIVDYLNSANVEAIFIPICDEGSYILAGQLRASENFTPIFGLEQWAKRAIKRGLGTLDKLLISTLPINYNAEIERESSLMRFEEAFNEIFGHPPSRFNIIGYDTGKLIRLLYQKNVLSNPEDVTRELNRMGIYHGLEGDILFGRDEGFITFYLVKYGKIQKLREEDYDYLKITETTP